MYCLKCGKEIVDNSAFCRYCGAPQGTESEQEEKSINEPDNGRNKNASEPTESKSAANEDAVKKSGNRIWLIGGIAAAAVLVVVLAAVSVTAVYNSPKNKYERQLSLGARYMDELDHDRAIAAYKAAIEIDPNDPEAYRALAELYLAMGDAVSAQETIQAGINASGDAGLTAMLAQVQASGADTESGQQAASGTMTVLVMAANETGAVSGAEVEITGSSGEFSAETDSDGKGVFDSLAYGEYTVRC
nr:tetratricopeptide repeat protein [Lachnospiraceae bacterium]